MKKIFLAQFICILAPLSFAQANPKYGPNASPLSQRSNQEYFQKNPAPDFWALIPYYLPQPTGSACGATTMTVMLNAARSAIPQKSDQKNLSFESFVKEYTDKNYEKAMFAKTFVGFDRSQVSNKNMARLLEVASEKLGIKTAATKATVVNIDSKQLEASKKRFIQDLKENEKSANDFILISFMQGVLTGDPEGGAHVAVIGAYDEKKGLALILDPDREYYEPYWAPVDKVFDSVKDPRADAIQPGYIYFKVR